MFVKSIFSRYIMKYYLIAGEASGDLHASHLMRSIKRIDPDAMFRFFGGDNMSSAGGDCVRHYRELAYMGFLPVLLHLPTILRNIRLCKRDIVSWQPDVVIPVDYAGFNLNICKFLTSYRRKHDRRRPHTFYYISPKIWAWKEWRIKDFRRDVEEMFCILPFEKEFFEQKHHYPVHYVGNPTADEVRAFKATYTETFSDFCRSNGLDDSRPVIAILAGSRMQEIENNLPPMLSAATDSRYQYVVAGAPSIDRTVYEPYLRGSGASLVMGQTYALLSHSTAAMVTSGTATLETAIFNVPQVVCYHTILPRLYRLAFNLVIKCRYISLVNLIAGSEVVQELFADRFSVANIREALSDILPGGKGRAAMLEGYRTVMERLGDTSAPDNAASEIVSLLRRQP